MASPFVYYDGFVDLVTIEGTELRVSRKRERGSERVVLQFTTREGDRVAEARPDDVRELRSRLWQVGGEGRASHTLGPVDIACLRNLVAAS